MRAASRLRILRTAAPLQPNSSHISRLRRPLILQRYFQNCVSLRKTQKHILSDIGEGVKEVQVIQWFVEEGAAVEEWAPLCEVQSDKASVEITSKYTGVVTKLHFDQDAIVQVGDAMLDIEVEDSEADGASEENIEQEQPPFNVVEDNTKIQHDDGIHVEHAVKSEGERQDRSGSIVASQSALHESEHRNNSGLATPAVRSMLKEHQVDISDVEGTGSDGRVLKEDVLKHIQSGKAVPPTTIQTFLTNSEHDAKQSETTHNLTPIQSAMFKSMTKSLLIPHFLFSDSVNITDLSSMRTRLNAARDSENTPKYTHLPFIVKAVSMSLHKYPILNGRLDLADVNKPKLVLRSSHNIGIAMDTPSGLVVPVVKHANTRSVLSIAQEIQRLGQLAQAGKLTNSDMSGGTITVSNIGSIGGEVLAPVIVEGQLAILGIGKIKSMPVFGADGKTVERADMMSMNWSADHRVVDGATMARMAKAVQKYLEAPEAMLVSMA